MTSYGALRNTTSQQGDTHTVISMVYISCREAPAAFVAWDKFIMVVQVASVQREFVEKLLTKPVFQRHMTAVREVLNMLRSAQKIRDQGGDWDGAPIKV